MFIFPLLASLAGLSIHQRSHGMVGALAVVFFRNKVVGASLIRTNVRRIFPQVISISIGRVRRFSTGFYGERPGQNQRTDRSIRCMRNNEEGVLYVDRRGYAMARTVTAQNISHTRCVAFVCTDWFCSTSCAGILVRPVLRSFRPKATPRAIYRYSDRVNKTLPDQKYVIMGSRELTVCARQCIGGENLVSRC